MNCTAAAGRAMFVSIPLLMHAGEIRPRMRMKGLS
jgi:hypothetical protein